MIRDRANNRPRPLHLIAHSQGSLVARRALQLLGPDLGRRLVDSLVLLGPATAGSFSAEKNSPLTALPGYGLLAVALTVVFGVASFQKEGDKKSAPDKGRPPTGMASEAEVARDPFAWALRGRFVLELPGVAPHDSFPLKRMSRRGLASARHSRRAICQT